jgi:hypothetical protein
MSNSEYRSEADRLAKVIWKIHGVKDFVDKHEEFFEMHERELVDEILNTVISRVETLKERSKP